MTIQLTIIARSIRTLNKKTGMVILVGNAARFVISDIPIAAIAILQNTILLPPRIIANKVIGVRTHP